jgi:hypothetical protein
MSEYSFINLTKTKKSPILRVQIKKAQKIINSKSTKNINRNFFHLDVPQTTRKNDDFIPIKKLYIRNNLNRCNSITSFNRFTKKDNMSKGEKEKYKNYIRLKQGKIKYIRNNNDSTEEENREKTEKELYCMNCINKKMNLQKNLSHYLNLNNSYNFSLHNNLSLKQLDEDYISNKIFENEKRQLAAFNHLKSIKELNPVSKKDKLQFINENCENPFHGLNLQDYLYYNNKMKNEKINKLVLSNVTSYELNEPRKEIFDYYNKVMFQTPLLEKDERPSNQYKMRYIKTLQNQIDEKKKEKINKKKAEIKKEKKELNEYNKILSNIRKSEKQKKLIKRNIIYENNTNMSNIKRENDETDRSNILKGYQNRMKIFKEQQKEYKSFINQQRINEINNIQSWINENKKIKNYQMNKEKRDDLRWKNYLKKYNETFTENTKADKCYECNLIYTNRLYPLQVP